MATLKAAKLLDLRSFTCPLVVVKAKKGITEVQPGDILEVWSTDPAAKNDIPAWTKRAGHELLETIEEGEVIKFWVKRALEDQS